MKNFDFGPSWEQNPALVNYLTFDLDILGTIYYTSVH